MKTFTATMGRLSALVVLLFVSTNLFAQVFRVYTKDGLHQEYAAENVDSIVFFTQPSDEPSDNPDPILPDPVLPDMHEAVDLGLPSGLKWATCNVGASSPEEYGDYYAWGETEEKNDVSWSTYKWSNGSYDSITKYCTSSKYGTVDNKTVLDPEDDVAHVKWGAGWRMPTEEEIKELLDHCGWEWSTKNSVEGYLITGPNGNNIFLPAAGLYDGNAYNTAGIDGFYWSATSYEYYSYIAFNLYFGPNNNCWVAPDQQRRFCLPIRPVTDE